MSYSSDKRRVPTWVKALLLSLGFWIIFLIVFWEFTRLLAVFIRSAADEAILFGAIFAVVALSVVAWDYRESSDGERAVTMMIATFGTNRAQY
jgi:hypothetical protein